MYVSGQLEWNFLVAHAAAAFTSSSSKQNATQQKLKKKHTHNLCRIIADSFSRIAAAAQSAMNHEVIVSIIARHRNQWAPTIETKNGIFTCAVCVSVFLFSWLSHPTHIGYSSFFISSCWLPAARTVKLLCIIKRSVAKLLVFVVCLFCYASVSARARVLIRKRLITIWPGKSGTA